MELKEFISETIKNITDGVLEGNDYVKERSKSKEGVRSGYVNIDFDIAITTSEEGKGEIGGKISVVEVFNAGGSKSKTSYSSNQNRVQFSVHVNIKTNDLPLCS